MFPFPKIDGECELLSKGSECGRYIDGKQRKLRNSGTLHHDELTWNSDRSVKISRTRCDHRNPPKSFTMPIDRSREERFQVHGSKNIRVLLSIFICSVRESPPRT